MIMALGAAVAKQFVDNALAIGNASTYAIPSFFTSPAGAASVGGGSQMLAIIQAVGFLRGWTTGTSDTQKLADIAGANVQMAAFVAALNAAIAAAPNMNPSAATGTHSLAEGGV